MITVHIPNCNQTQCYANECKRVTISLAEKPEEINFVFHDLVPNGSIGHAQCLQRIVSNLHEGVNVICDSDSVLVMKNWDTIVLKELENVDCIATQFDDWDRPPHNGDVIQSYKKKPHFIWAAFRQGKDWSKLDFGETNTSVAIEIKTQEQSDLYGLAIGRRIGHDTGWKTSHFWGEQQATFKLFNHSRKRLVLGSLPTHNEEYELDGVPFVCHQRSCRKTPFKQGMSKAFYDAVAAYNLKHE